MNSSLIKACNSALAKISKGPINSIEEESVEAQYCALFASEILEEMAEWTVWPNLIKRVALAEIANDRPAEWLHAYALPDDYGEAILVREQQEGLTSAPQVAAPYTLPYQDTMRIAFLIEGKVIYSNTPQMVLAYSKNRLEAADLNALMRRAFIDELAYRLATPVGKLPLNRLQGLQSEAFASKYEAMADAQNKSPQFEQSFTSLAEYARMGAMG